MTQLSRWTDMTKGFKQTLFSTHFKLKSCTAGVCVNVFSSVATVKHVASKKGLRNVFHNHFRVSVLLGTLCGTRFDCRDSLVIKEKLIIFVLFLFLQRRNPKLPFVSCKCRPAV